MLAARLLQTLLVSQLACLALPMDDLLFVPSPFLSSYHQSLLRIPAGKDHFSASWHCHGHGCFDPSSITKFCPLPRWFLSRLLEKIPNYVASQTIVENSPYHTIVGMALRYNPSCTTFHRSTNAKCWFPHHYMSWNENLRNFLFPLNDAAVEYCAAVSAAGEQRTRVLTFKTPNSRPSNGPAHGQSIIACQRARPAVSLRSQEPSLTP